MKRVVNRKRFRFVSKVLALLCNLFIFGVVFTTVAVAVRAAIPPVKRIEITERSYTYSCTQEMPFYLSEETNEQKELSNFLCEPTYATTFSKQAVEMVKHFEGCRLTAYQLTGEKDFTIGYGSSSGSPLESITPQEAEQRLLKELGAISNRIAKNRDYTQNQLDALVSFTYNCGFDNYLKLTNNRTNEEIAAHLTAYTKSASESNRKGLLRRRKAEQQLFLKEVTI